MSRSWPVSQTNSRTEALLAAIHAETDCFLDLAQRETDAAAQGDLEQAEHLHPLIQQILDHRRYLIREFAKLFPQAS